MNAFCVKHDMFRAHCDCSLYEDTPEGEYVAVAVKPEPFVCQCFNRDFQKSADEVNARCPSLNYTAEDFENFNIDLCMATSCGIRKPVTIDDFSDGDVELRSLGRKYDDSQHLLQWEEEDRARA